MITRRLFSLSLACLLATFTWSLGASADTVYVHPTEGLYNTVTEGMAAAFAGDTILVGPGTYPTFTVDKQFSILSEEGPDVTIIESAQSVKFTSAADNSVLSGFTITISGDDGIYVNTACDGLMIENNIVTGSGGHGIYLTVSDPDLRHTTIRNNTITDNAKSGIYMYLRGSFEGSAKLSNTEISNNILTRNSTYGIQRDCSYHCESVEDVIVHNNVGGNNLGDILNVIPDPLVDPSLGNISVNPRFLNPDEGDFHLQYSEPLSPCINAGRIGVAYNDPDGTRSDMGVYGGPGAVNWWPYPAGGPVVTELSVTPHSVPVGGTLTLNATGKVR